MSAASRFQSDSPPAAAPPPRARKARRAFWLKQLHSWHWMSSALSLIGLLLFAITGFTLNHAADIEATPKVREDKATLPATLLLTIAPEVRGDGKAPLPAPVARWVGDRFKVRTEAPAEWSSDAVYLALPRPGGDAWVSIDRFSGEATHEDTDRGWLAWANDLHKGRNAGRVWFWFIDVFAGACLVFALTGLVLLQLHAARRPGTWPIVGLGLLIPAAIALFFIH